MKNLIVCFLFAATVFINQVKAQNLAVNTTGALPDASAMIDVASTSKGFLAPRMTTTQQNAISSPAKGLLIYNTTTDLFMVNTGTSSSPVWTALSTGSSGGWSVNGNSGTNSSTNFLGTTDNVNLGIRTNNLQRMVVDNQGRVGVGVTNPANPMVVKDTLEIRRVGTVSELLFANTAGTGDFRIGSDGSDIFWQGGGGRNLQMGSYWGVQLMGDRQSGTFPAFSTGTGNTGVMIQAQRDASVPLAIQPNSSSQSANLTEWRNSSGTAINVVNKNGNMAIGNSSFNSANPEKLLVDAGTTSSVNAIAGKGSIDSYLQLNIQNQSTGTSASSDVVATANNGDETTNYVDMGINGGNYSGGVMGAANDGYLYTMGNNFLIGTGAASKSVVFMTGGTSQASNERMRIDGTGNVGIGTTAPSYKLQVNAASNPLQLTGLQTGTSADSILTVSNGVVKRLNASALTSSSSNAWGLTGNASTTPSTNFIGTTDNQSLVFKANNQLSGKIDLPLNTTLFGYQASQAASTGINNTYMGYQSGYPNTSGQSNTGLGSISLVANTTGTGNTAVGYAALRNTLSGGGNSAVGNSAGVTNTTGSNNTFIGNSADASSANLSNATAIGYNARVATSNSMILGGTGASAVNVGIGTTTFNSTNPEKLIVDAGTTTSVNAIVGKGSIDSYLQLNIQNQSTGNSASSDVVATANNGDETTNYVDMGINGGSYSGGVMGTANDGYLYTMGNNFLLGTGNASKSLIFMTGGTSQSANERMRIDGTGNVGIGTASPSYKLQVSAASNPLQLAGLQTGANTDSVLTVSNGVVRRLNVSALTVPSSGWGLTGNAGTSPSTNFLGTTDAQALVIKENNTQVGRFEANSIALGNGSAVNTATHSTALGSGATISTGKTAATAIGKNASVTVDNSTAIGLGTVANGTGSVALGNSATVNASNSVAIGNSASTAYSISDALAIGSGATSNSNNTVIIGKNASSAFSISDGIGIGTGAVPNATNAIAIGNGATTGFSITNPVAIGVSAAANGSNSTVIGNGASIGTAANTTVIGAGASITNGASNSTAIGYNTDVTKSDEIILGDMTNSALSVGIGTENFSSSNKEKLLVDAGTTTSVNAIVGKGSINSYLQLNIQNQSGGTSASSDVVATANNGDETSNYVDMGINGGSYSGGVMGAANDGYLYTMGNNFLLGTGNANKSLIFMTGGTSQASNERMRIDGSGNVGIGNTSPGQKLDVTGNMKLSGAFMPGNNAGTAGYFLQSMGSGAAPVWYDASSYLNSWAQGGNAVTSLKTLGTTSAYALPFITNNTEKMRLTTAGRLGLGTTTPNYAFHIYDATVSPSAGTWMQISNNASGSGNYDGLFYGVNQAGGPEIWAQNNLDFITGSGTTNNASMRIGPNGNVGINTTTFNSSNPEQLVVDAGATSSVNAIVGKGSINSYLQLNIQNNSNGTSASSDVVATANNGNETTNYVDMGINGGSYSGGVMGAANDGYLYTMGNNFLLGTGAASKSLIFMTGGTSQSSNERMRIDGSGNVGIGTVLPGNKLEVNSGTGGVSGLRLKQLPTGGVLFMSSAADVTQNNNNFYYDATNYRLGLSAGTSPNSTLQVTGSVSTAITAKTATYTASASDYTIICNNTSGAITINLPAASGISGRMYIIKKVSGAGNNVIIDGSGSETIDGALTKTLTTQYDTMLIQCDGSNWFVLSNN